MKKHLTIIQDVMPFDLVNEEEVLNSEAYKNYSAFNNREQEERLKKFSSVVTPEGYLNYNPNTLNKKKILRMIETMPSKADGMMIIYLNYTMVKKKGAIGPLSNAAISAEIHLRLYDKEGKVVMKINKKAESDMEMQVIAGAMPNPEHVLPMCEEATENVFMVVDEFIKKEMTF